MMFGNNRDQLRLQYFRAWQAHLSGAATDPLQKQIIAVLIDHPEYQPLFQNEASIGTEYAPEQGQTNPFLHMGMHLAIREQVSTDRPAGIHECYQQLVAREGGDHHRAEHRMVDCLGEFMWRSQQSGIPPDETDYLLCLQALLK